MATMIGSFRTAEVRAAAARWREVTGLAEEGTEWGEVWQVLEQCGLLEADRAPQGSLFDAPDTPVGETGPVRELRLVLMAGAYYSVECGVDPAVAVAVVAALLRHEFSDLGLTVEQELTLLRMEVPARVVAVSDTPAEALAVPLMGVTAAVEDLPALPELVAVVLSEATRDDGFARRVFARLAADPRWRTKLVELCHGQWLTYRTEFP